MKASLKIVGSVLLGLVLAGCSAKTPSTDAGERTLRVWHWMSDREDVLSELGRRYEAETGVKVRFELFAPSEVYAQRVKASAQTSTLPDIFGVLGEKRDFASLILSGHIANLTAEMNAADPDWKHEYFRRPFDVNSFEPGNEFGVEPGLYGIPIDAASIQMVYNKRLLREAGADAPPGTWEEFLRVCSALKSKGTSCLVCGFGEVWMIEAMASNWAMNWMGEEKVFDTYRGRVPYTDPDWVHVLGLFRTIADEGILMPGSVTMANKMAEQPFANERAAFTFNGSWCINVFRGMNPSLEYGAMLPPRPNPDRPMKIWAGAGTSFMVNARSPRRRQALDFLRWLTAEPQQTFLAQKTDNLPVNPKAIKNLSGVLSEFADDIEDSTHPNVYPIHESVSVSEAFEKGIQSILIGQQTPEEVARDVQKAKEKDMAQKRERAAEDART